MIKRIWFLIIAILICAGAIFGCAPSHSDKTPETPEPTQVLTTIPTLSPTEFHSADPTQCPFDEPSPKPITQELDYFAIPDAIRDKLTAADIDAYEKIIPAYLGYETSIEFSADDEIVSLEYLIELCFPIFYSDVDETSIEYGSNTVSWKYTTTEKEHAELISQFESKALDYIALLTNDDSMAMRCLVIYNAFTSRVKYDTPTSDYYDGTDPDYDGELYDHCFDSILNEKGVCWCYGRGYAFLLNQIGVEALTVSADGGVGHHEWTLFKLGGKWYYADPTWDKSESLTFFGFTSNARTSYGYYVVNTRYFAGADYPIEGVFDISDTRFSDIYTGVCFGDFYELDRENNQVVFYDYSGGGIYEVSAEFDLG
ncbi:MAG: hypothetical protein J1E60_03680 [Christensenellaceae bacterium]|nr:hypothetical protein [Christensenellaceae bacterium]